MCSFVYIVNLLIFFILLRVFFNAGLSFRESIVRSYKDALLNWPWLGLVLVMIGFLWYSFPSYWVKADVNGLLESPHGTTEKGYPWIGAEDPELVIEEYSDYFCPYCKRAHFLQRQIVRGNQGRVRLVHRHFPLDEACNPLITRPFHPGACLFAKAAICAKSQGKFWEINDSLYSRESLKGETWEAKINSAARGVGLNLSQFGECLSSDTAHKELREDIDEGLFLQLQGTPSFVVDSKVYVGGLDEEVFRQYGLSNPLAQD
jgi:protein-disulfide isomerase